MALVTISFQIDTVKAPNAVARLVEAATEWAAGQNPPRDISGLTAAQKVKAYAIGIFSDVVKQRQIATTRVTTDATLAAANDAADAEVKAGLA